TFDLRALIACIPPANAERHLIVKVLWQQRSIGAWSIDLAPIDVNVSCEWRTPPSGDLFLDAGIVWTGVSSQCVEVKLLVGDQEASIRAPAATASDPDIGELSALVTIPVGTVCRAHLAAGCDAKITVSWNSIVLLQQHVPAPSSQSVRPTSPDAI